jgi:hypothetical protein
MNENMKIKPRSALAFTIYLEFCSASIEINGHPLLGFTKQRDRMVRALDLGFHALDNRNRVIVVFP